ncbi:UDP-forming cellulose synthase catalytic subunit [Pollutimonas subterranea]|uniref:Cellulose synthase catalytic subunit [UDP-forming] n=2 Tax=Pollutimonas subterranea TaxID=2045210 RepID=A0A2N4U035_9BURK|nr:UDP-forming cellulose synthase catalytic subunit [Pollutimonas subterranea]PLC48379.1 UDP-forming cellulose synthase catalytic subunit [Pollutimonas subterranea]
MSAGRLLLLTPRGSEGLERIYHGACQVRGLSGHMAVAYTVLVVIAYIFLRLEGPAWRRLRHRYAPWFLHLTSRPLMLGDPMRYALQTLWILIALPAQRVSPAWWRAIEWVGAQFYSSIKVFRQWVGGHLLRIPISLKTSPTLKRSGAALSQCGKTTRQAILVGGGALATGLIVLLITQPFNVYAQLIFVVLLWSVAMVLRRVPGQVSTLMLIVLSVTISGRYIWWRYTSTLNWSNGLDATLGMLLLMAETYSWVVLLMGYVQTAWPLNRAPSPLPADTEQWPIVDLMIPTYNEGLSIVEPTVYAALGMDWPKHKLRIHLLDDGRRESFRTFAKEVGINYIVRSDGKHAKAGNLNHALGETSGELIAVFDCDHIPTRSFLQMTIGWFLRDPKLALVQTPHHFFSPDPFERNLGHFGDQPNENTLFYGLVQDGNDLWNAAFFCGSCAVLRRSSLESIGGFAVETVTEDAHTALRLHRNGYNSAYLRIPQAAGLATDSLSAHIGQRIRWARGMVQIFRTDNPLFGKGLSFFQRLCYVNAMLHFLSGIPRIIYLTAPLAFLLAHSYIIYAPAVAIMLNVLPHMAHASLTSSHIQGSYRRTFWAEIYETVLAWYIARPTTVALFAPNKGSFNVTAKGGLVEQGYFDWTISHPYVWLALANIVGLAFGVWRLCMGPADEILTVAITMAWVMYNLVILGGAIAVASEVKQIRHTHRVPASLPAAVQFIDGHVVPTILSDYSEGGVGLKLSTQRNITLNEPITVLLARGDRQFSFPGHVSRSMNGSIGVRFASLTRQQHIDLVQCTFARADSWLAWQAQFKLDRPLQSLRDIALVGFGGYRRLVNHVPFPLNVIFRGVTALGLSGISFIPRRQPVSIILNTRR